MFAIIHDNKYLPHLLDVRDNATATATAMTLAVSPAMTGETQYRYAQEVVSQRQGYIGVLALPMETPRFILSRRNHLFWTPVTGASYRVV